MIWCARQIFDIYLYLLKLQDCVQRDTIIDYYVTLCKIEKLNLYHMYIEVQKLHMED